MIVVCMMLMLACRWRAWPVADDWRPVLVVVRRLYRWRLPWEPWTAPLYTAGCAHCWRSAVSLPVTTARRQVHTFTAMLRRGGLHRCTPCFRQSPINLSQYPKFGFHFLAHFVALAACETL